MRLRLSTFSEIVGEEKHTLRGRIARGDSPLRPEPVGGARQRDYDGRDVFAWVTFARLREAGLSAPEAGDAVRCSRAADEWAEELSEARRRELYLIRTVEFRERARPFPLRMPHTLAMVGGPGDIVHLPLKLADLEGRPVHEGETDPRHAGLESLLALPLAPSERAARDALRAHGYDLTDTLEIYEPPNDAS